MLNTGVAIFVSAMVALAGWLFTNRANAVMDRRRHTYQVFREYRNRKQYRKALSRASELIIAKNIPAPDDEKRKADCQAIETVIEQFEFLAIAIFNGDIDERFMRSAERTVVCRIPDRFGEYIEKKRELYTQPSMYEAVEHLCDRWTNDKRRLFGLAIEFVILRPLRPRKRKKEAPDD